MCNTCDIENIDDFNMTVEQFKAIFCKDRHANESPLIVPQTHETPHERFNSQQFGILLCKLRDSYKFTQAQAAERVGISRRTWNSIESGRSVPKIDTVVAIADLFDRSIENLLRE